MSYQPLARKYRPKKFKDLIGQEAVALALKGAIRLKREPAAVIFAGIRGVGKTTAARIYAMALNCQSPGSEEGEPCGLCGSCEAIIAGRHEDVSEIDGASHNGVDEVRFLKETLQYLPQRSGYKVYIIDEVHMLSVSAFNALLKTLEEPPPRVVFIFATTELHKVPQTIVGRCQTFWLRKMTLADTEKHLSLILEAEKIFCDPKSLALIARQGQGSMRDALTSLDQAIVFSGGELCYDRLAPLFSGVSTARLLDLMEAMVRREATVCLRLVRELDQDGRDFSDIAVAMARLARGGFLGQVMEGGTATELARDLEEDEIKRLADIAQQCQSFDFNRIFRTFVSCQKDMDGGDLDRFILENYCLEWCLDPGLPDFGQLQHLLHNAAADPDRKAPASGTSVSSGQPVAVRPPLLSQFQALAKTTGASEKSLSASATSEKEEREGDEAADEAAKEKLQADEGRAVVDRLPGSWQALVSEWKKYSLLQAAILEELVLVHYGSDLIECIIKPQSLAAAELGKPGAGDHIRKTLKERFSFQGELRFRMARNDVVLQEEGVSLLEERKLRKARDESSAIREVRDHPMTRVLADTFGSTDIEVTLQSTEEGRAIQS